MAHLLMAKYSPPASTQRQANIAIALFTASSFSPLVEQMVIGRDRSSPPTAGTKLTLGKFGSLAMTCGTEKYLHSRLEPDLETMPARDLRAQLEGVRQREQQARAAPFIVRRSVAQRERHADIGPQVIPQEEAHAGAGRSQRKTVVDAVAVIPGRAGVDEAIELIAAQISKVQLLIETKFERAGNAVVATDLGTAIAPPKVRTSKIELLRSEQRAGSDLAGPRRLYRPDVGQCLVAREPEVENGEIGRRTVVRHQILANARGAENVETLTVRQRHVVVAADIVLQSVIRGQAQGADVIVVDRAEHVAFRDVAEVGGRSERQRRSLRLQRGNAGADLEGFGPCGVVVKPPVVAGPDVAIERRRTDPQPVGADRDIIGQSAESKLPGIVGRGREVERQRVAGQQIGIECGGRIGLPRANR